VSQVAHPDESLGPAPRVAVRAGPFATARLRRRIQRLRSRLPRGSLTEREFGVRSQNGEDGVIQELLEAAGIRKGFFVEFGIGTGDQGNCVLLADKLGWSGLFMEADPESFGALARKYRRTTRVQTAEADVTVTNVEQLFTSHGVPAELSVLSIDIDGNDYWVWEAVTGFRPDIVIVEYNAALGFDRKLVMSRDDAHRWDGTDYFGASLAAYCSLADSKGYDLVHTDRTGVNAFYVRRGISLRELPEAVKHPPNYLGRGITLPRDTEDRPFLDLDTNRLVRADRTVAA
jgi:hypothetical protein